MNPVVTKRENETVLEAEDLLIDELDEAAIRTARERRIAMLRLLWERRQFLLRAAISGLVLATLVAFLIPRRFESTARLMPPDPQSGQGIAMLAALSGRAGGLAPIAGDLLGLKSTSAIFTGILNSRTVQDRMIEQFDLRLRYQLLPIGSARIEDVRDELQRRTRISEDRKSGIITLTVWDHAAERAQAMASAYVSELDRVVAEVSTSAARRERIFLEERLQAVKMELDEAAKQFSQFASKNTTIDIKEQGRAMVEAAAALQGQIIAAQTELQGLRQVYTDNNVRVRAAQARIGELNRQLERLGGTRESLTSDAPADSGAAYPSIRKLPLLGVEYANRYRRTKIAEVVFELLTQQYELAKVQEAKEIPSVKVLDAPVVPEKKSFPPRLLILAMGTAFALACGIVWIWGGARWDEIDTQDSGKILARDVIAALGAGSWLAPSNGNGAGNAGGWLRNRFRRERARPAEQTVTATPLNPENSQVMPNTKSKEIS